MNTVVAIADMTQNVTICSVDHRQTTITLYKFSKAMDETRGRSPGSPVVLMFAMKP